MAIATTARTTSPLTLLLLITLISLTSAEIRTTKVKSNNQPIIPIDEFGFTHKGRMELNVTGISLSSPRENLDLSKLGFFLCTRDSWHYVLEQLEESEISCALDSSLIKRVYTFNSLPVESDSFGSLFIETDLNQYTLVFANCCPESVKVSMKVRSAMYNLVGKTRNRDYLSVGRTILPRVYLFFSTIYWGMAVLWFFMMCKDSLFSGEHIFIFAVVIMKALNLLCEAEDKSYIKRTGSAHGWDVFFCVFSFLKGFTFFTLIVLIAVCLSMLKDFLQDREKKVFTIVTRLQVVAIFSQAVIGETNVFNQDYWITWKQLFFLVDGICCCAVLFLIKAVRTSNPFSINLMRFKYVRAYYIAVICYIYFTRVIVCALDTVTSYTFLWSSVVAAELATLAFYAFSGYKFRGTRKWV